MVRRRRFIGFTVLVVAFLAGNFYSGVVLWTLTAGPVVTATVTDCSAELFAEDCRGEWTMPDGTTGGGELTGADRVAVGDTVPVRVGPIGAYADDDMWEQWPRLVPGAVVDLGILTGFALTGAVYARRRGQRRTFAAERHDRQVLWRVRRTGVYDARDALLYRPRRERGHVTALCTAAGTPVHLLRYEDDGPRPVSLTVSMPDGRALCSVQVIPASRLTMALCDAEGVERARIEHRGAMGMLWSVTAADGTHLGTILGEGRVSHVAFEPAAPEQARLGTAAFLLEQRAMTTAGAMLAR